MHKHATDYDLWLDFCFGHPGLMYTYGIRTHYIIFSSGSLSYYYFICGIPYLLIYNSGNTLTSLNEHKCAYIII